MLGQMVVGGGPVMYILIGCSVFALAIVLERAMFWLTEIRRTPSGKIEAFVCWLKAGSKGTRPESGSSAIMKTLNEVAEGNELRRVIGLLKLESERAYERGLQHLSGLDTVVSIAPLLGILGTVLGIMKSFQALDLQTMTMPGEVGHGLAEAMITTAAGLVIAVPVLVLYNIFHSLAGRHAAKLYKLAEDLALESDNSVHAVTVEAA